MARGAGAAGPRGGGGGVEDILGHFTDKSPFICSEGI